MSPQDSADSSPLATSLVVFLLGMAVGATVAILYAPSAGRETREHLAESAARIKERAAELSHQVADKATELKDKAAEITEKVASKVRHTSEAEQTTAPDPSDA